VWKVCVSENIALYRTQLKAGDRSCLLHRFVRGECEGNWNRGRSIHGHVAYFKTGRILSSQTIGVEFSSKIIKVGTGSRRKRIKLQVIPSICSFLLVFFLFAWDRDLTL